MTMRIADTRAGRNRRRPTRTTIGTAIAVLACAGLSPTMFPAALAAEPRQIGFASPEQAADALASASQTGRTGELERILGPAGRKLIHSGDPVADKEARAKFAAYYAEDHKLERPSDDKAILTVSPDAWPFPIPLVRQGSAWRFDTKAGAEEILDRRIGRNELNAIQVCQAIVDAERDYASIDRTGTGYQEYAGKFMSSPGKRDGLYWPAAPGDESPIGPLVANARAEGYGGRKARDGHLPYHGYYYRIVAQQGAHAPGGAYSYVANGHMIGGFALIAFPADYGNSGVMTFMVNQDGVIYEKNLGPRTATLARGLATFDPDGSWAPHKP